MRRLLALVAAAAMVAGSIAIRARLEGSEEDRDNPLRVVCAVELGAVCDTLRPRVTVEATAATADRLGRAAGSDLGIDGWLVPAPWPQIVDGRRRRASLPPLFADVGTPLARSPLVLVIEKGLAERIGPRCGGAVGWKCLGEQAGMARPRHPEPGSAFGALILGQATAAFFGRVDDLSTFDLDDPGFTKWFQALERAAPAAIASAGSPLDEMLGTTFAAYNAVGTIEAEAGPVVAASALRDRVAVLYPSPMATADVVLAGATGATGRLRGLADSARKALAGAGWRTGGTAGPPGAPALPPTNGLPSPGFLDALRDRRP